MSESKKKIKSSTTIGEALSINSKASKILAENQMFCGCCPMAMMETIEQGAEAHGKNLKKILEQLNKK